MGIARLLLRRFRAFPLRWVHLIMLGPYENLALVSEVDNLGDSMVVKWCRDIPSRIMIRLSRISTTMLTDGPGYPQSHIRMT